MRLSMLARGKDRRFLGLCIVLLGALMSGVVGCISVTDGSIHVRGGRGGEDNVRLPDAEQMIDELDRIMTTNGTIGVKSPDVWGQDRLAKFRSEYETQMSEWLKTAFKGEVNAAVRRGETEVRRLHVGTRATRRREDLRIRWRDRLQTPTPAHWRQGPSRRRRPSCSSQRSFSTNIRTT
jgi:hypothetical protein